MPYVTLLLRFAGNFTCGGQTVGLDTLLNERSAISEDNDSRVARQVGTPAKRTDHVDFSFQTNECTVAKCRYRHACSLCRLIRPSGLDTNLKWISPGDWEDDRQDKQPHSSFHRARARFSSIAELKRYKVSCHGDVESY